MLPQMDFQHWFHNICIVKYNLSEVDFYLGKHIWKRMVPKNQKLWVFFSSLERAHTEHMLATRFWRPGADDGISHTAINIIIIAVVVLRLNVWLNIEFLANWYSTLFSL